MTTFDEALTATEQALLDAGVYCGHGYDSVHDEAVALLLYAAGLPVDTGTEILSRTLSDDARARLADAVAARTEARLPTAYITGTAWLGPLCFRSDARALVPRSPIMSLIGDGFAPWWQGSDPARMVDVCCGGGSLGLLAAFAFPETEVVLTDIDTDALALASENHALHGFANARVVQGDLLSALAPASVDIILANPPYVDQQDMDALPPEYRHEPVVALAAGDDGLALVHRLLVEASDVLSPQGLLFMEVGNSWEALESAYPSVAFTWLHLESGGHGICVLSHDELKALAGRALTLSQSL